MKMKETKKIRKPMSKKTKTLLLMTLPALILFVLFNTIPLITGAEVGKVFEQVLLDAGVFKRDKAGRQAFNRFINTLINGG